MLSLSAISDTAISALPSSNYNDGTATLYAKFMFEAVPQSVYRDFVTDGSRMLTYAVEINRHRVRTTA